MKGLPTRHGPHSLVNKPLADAACPMLTPQLGSVEFTPHEIAATLLMKRKYKKRTEVIPESMPTIEQFTIWLADLGGYTGKSSGGPPGSVTIKRGLDFIMPIAEALAILEEERKMR